VTVSVEFSVCAAGRVRLPHAARATAATSAKANVASARGTRNLGVMTAIVFQETTHVRVDYWRRILVGQREFKRLSSLDFDIHDL
jgi:hypothetical protein